MPSKRYATVGDRCVACGCCVKVCPMGAVSVWRGVIAQVNREKCVGCGKCERECPAGAIGMHQREGQA